MQLTIDDLLSNKIISKRIYIVDEFGVFSRKLVYSLSNNEVDRIDEITVSDVIKFKYIFDNINEAIAYSEFLNGE